MARSNYGSPNPSSVSLPLSRERRSSNDSRAEPSSNRSSTFEDLSFENLTLSESEHENKKLVDATITIDPRDLVRVRRIGEGTGGAVELVKNIKTGQTMARKVRGYSY
jgi:mitogen-activated protein kinase kinase